MYSEDVLKVISQVRNDGRLNCIGRHICPRTMKSDETQRTETHRTQTEKERDASKRKRRALSQIDFENESERITIRSIIIYPNRYNPPHSQKIQSLNLLQNFRRFAPIPNRSNSIIISKRHNKRNTQCTHTPNESILNSLSPYR